VRCLAPLIVTCLLVAGASPRPAVHLQPKPRQIDAIAAAKALDKLAVRRTESVRPVSKLDLDPIALPNVRSIAVPPRVACDAPRATRVTRLRVAAARVNARGPPLA
jgi:hypothetical protein